MNHKLKTAIEESKILLNKHPDHLPFKILIDQLYFIKDYYDGKTTDNKKLKAVNLSYIITREVEHINEPLADLLCEIYDYVRKTRGENIYKM